MDPTQPYYQFSNTGSSSAPVRYFEEFNETQWVEPSFGYREEESLQTLPNGGRDISPYDPFPPSHHTWPYLPNQQYDQYPQSQRYNQFQTYPQGPPGPTLPWAHGTLTCLNCENPPEHKSVRCQSCTFFNRGISPEEEARHCMKCLVPIDAPDLFCPIHLGRYYLSGAEIQHLHQDGVCYVCNSREVGPHDVTCAECKSHRNDVRHGLQQRRLDAGYCKVCGTNCLDNETETCNECLEKKRARNRVIRRVPRSSYGTYSNSLSR